MLFIVHLWGLKYLLVNLSLNSHFFYASNVEFAQNLRDPFSKALKRIENNSSPQFAPWESDMKRPQPCQVQSSLIPCMLRHLNRAEAAGPPVCESAGFPEERQWHPVFRLSARQWSFCIPKDPRTPRTWLPVSHARPTTAVPDQRSGTLCLKCELSLPPLSPFDDSLGADSLNLRVLRAVGGCGPKGVYNKTRGEDRKLLKDCWINA